MCISLCLFVEPVQAGLRTLHEIGPQIKRAISGNLEGMDENEQFEHDEPNHRVSSHQRLVAFKAFLVQEFVYDFSDVAEQMFIFYCTE